MKVKIDDCKKYWEEFVEPDFNEFSDDPGSVRKAFHCAIALFHMSDWIYKAKGLPYWQSKGLSFTDTTSRSVAVHDDKSFANALAMIDPNFELVRNIANSAKHFSLDKPGKHPSSPSHVANTYSRMEGFDKSAFDESAFDASDAVMLEGPGGADLAFLELATSVRSTMEKFCAEHGIELK